MAVTLVTLFLSGTWTRLFQAIVLGTLESWKPAVPGQRKLRRGLALDVVYAYVVPLLIYPAVYGAVRLLGHVARDLNLQTTLGRQSLALQIVLAVVVGDFVAYWKHRLLHTRLFWPFHAVHHSSVEVDWLSNERVHPVESAFNALLQAAALLLLGFGPRAIALAVVIRQSYSVFTHANLRLSYGRLGWLFVSPRHHRWHHADDGALANRNFANIFAIFDLLGGTHAVRATEPTSFGLPDGGRVPDGFVRQLIAPFVEFANRCLRRPVAVLATMRASAAQSS
jgi:sterol desaturase/sphingolipid hydroxylase (fatty acid hydroxylase superfamily)